MVALDRAGVNDGEDECLRVRFGRSGCRDGVDFDDEYLADLTPECLRDEVGWAVAIACVPIYEKFVLEAGMKCQHGVQGNLIGGTKSLNNGPGQWKESQVQKMTDIPGQRSRHVHPQRESPCRLPG